MLNPQSFANVGGNWTNGTNAGTFYSNVNYSTSNSNSNIGTHLVIPNFNTND